MNQQIFKEIQSLKRQILPNEKVILFGSQARGDAREDSDWDLLVLLNKEKSDFNEDYDNYANPFCDIGFKYGTFISVIIDTKKEWETHPSLLRYNVEREGIEVI
ncbi:MAG: nucleotidyltransferase domain-containing protein [Dysgonamonadaceae bacterium]|jgi:predicted nucleotidyltransferase|nr:nucleotidyltransferase domain-containing protein [Dysgonamonadaceae bacterium]